MPQEVAYTASDFFNLYAFPNAYSYIQLIESFGKLKFSFEITNGNLHDVKMIVVPIINLDESYGLVNTGGEAQSDFNSISNFQIRILQICLENAYWFNVTTISEQEFIVAIENRALRTNDIVRSQILEENADISQRAADTSIQLFMMGLDSAYEFADSVNQSRLSYLRKIFFDFVYTLTEEQEQSGEAPELPLYQLRAIVVNIAFLGPTYTMTCQHTFSLLHGMDGFIDLQDNLSYEQRAANVSASLRGFIGEYLDRESSRYSTRYSFVAVIPTWEPEEEEEEEYDSDDEYENDDEEDDEQEEVIWLEAFNSPQASGDQEMISEDSQVVTLNFSRAFHENRQYKGPRSPELFPEWINNIEDEEIRNEIINGVIKHRAAEQKLAELTAMQNNEIRHTCPTPESIILCPEMFGHRNDLSWNTSSSNVSSDMFYERNGQIINNTRILKLYGSSLESLTGQQVSLVNSFVSLMNMHKLDYKMSQKQYRKILKRFYKYKINNSEKCSFIRDMFTTGSINGNRRLCQKIIPLTLDKIKEIKVRREIRSKHHTFEELGFKVSMNSSGIITYQKGYNGFQFMDRYFVPLHVTMRVNYNSDQGTVNVKGIPIESMQGRHWHPHANNGEFCLGTFKKQIIESLKFSDPSSLDCDLIGLLNCYNPSSPYFKLADVQWQTIYDKEDSTWKSPNVFRK